MNLPYPDAEPTETFDEYMKRNTYDPAQFMAYNAGDYSADELRQPITPKENTP